MNDAIDRDNRLYVAPCYCRIPRLSPHESDALIGALESILMALAEARWPDPNDELPANHPEPETDEIPF